jgi:hypothetical protein
VDSICFYCLLFGISRQCHSRKDTPRLLNLFLYTLRVAQVWLGISRGEPSIPVLFQHVLDSIRFHMHFRTLFN